MIAHGWADDPTRGWIVWLVQQLQRQGIEAIAPQFPNPKTPDIPAWLQTLNEAIGQPDDELVLVGHSLGCLIACKYLADADNQIAGLVLVAGMTTTQSWQPPGLYPLDWDKVKGQAAQRICIYSDDDDKVEPARTKELANLIDAELVSDPGKGHFAGIQGCSQLPSALQAVLSCYNLK